MRTEPVLSWSRNTLSDVEAKQLVENTDHRENKPPKMSVDGQMNHLLDWVKVWIIQVPQEPQHAWPENLHTNTNRHLEYYEQENVTVTVRSCPLYLSEQ